MAFVVDGAEWCFNGWSTGEIVYAIESLLDRVQTARDRNETVWIGDDLQTRPILDDYDLWSLSSASSPVQLPGELWQELAAWLGMASRYLDDEWPDGMDDTCIQIGSAQMEDNVDVAWAHHKVRCGCAVACLGLKRSGPQETLSNQGKSSVHWVTDEVTHRAFWRAAINVEGDNEATLERLAPHAFPDLYFRHGVWHGLHRLAGGYLALRSEIGRGLAVLDDYGKWAFTFPPPALSPREPIAAGHESQRPSNQVIERRFQGLGLTMAPEKPEVFADGKCRLAREITIGAHVLYCGWHVKLEPHRNRLHVHSPIPESDERVVIAIFDEHLPLPG